jgi:hypothetical protein
LKVSTISQNSAINHGPSVYYMSLWVTFHIQTITFFSWPTKAHSHLIIQNAFSSFLKLLSNLTIQTLFKCLKSLLRLGLSPFRIKKKVTYFQDTMAQSKHSYSKRKEWGNSKEGSNQSKTLRKNTKVLQLQFWHLGHVVMWCKIQWSWATPHMALPISVNMASILGWICSLPLAFLSRYSTFLIISNFLGSPL